MEGMTILALAVAVPIVLFPVALVWYINIGGVIHAVRAARERKAEAVAKTLG